MQLLFSFDQDMVVGKTLIQTLVYRFFSTLMQLLFSSCQDMEVGESFTNCHAVPNLARQFSPVVLNSTVLSLFISIEKLIIFTVNEHENICIARLNRRPGYVTALMRLLFSFDQDTRVEKTLVRTLVYQLSCNSYATLFLVWLEH